MIGPLLWPCEWGFVYSNGSEWLLKYIVREPWVFLLQGVLEAARPKEGFYIRSGITIILKNSTIMPGTVI